jgi:hypothetical protein
MEAPARATPEAKQSSLTKVGVLAVLPRPVAKWQDATEQVLQR